MRTQAATTFKEKSWKAGARGFHIISGICLLVGLSFSAYPQTSSQKAVQKEKTMKTQAKGTFDVKVIPQAADENAGDGVGRFLLDKQFHGDLEAASKGQMLAAGSPADGSGGYVAMEKVSGTLNGRKGSFVLQHTGTMKGGVAEMNVTVVPGSGTEQLVGLAGKMEIIIADGKHSYQFEYTLADTH